MKKMEKSFQVIVTGASALTHGKEELTYTWHCESPWQAINFASGFVESIEWVNELTANRPLVQSTDGYWWRFEKGLFAGLKVRVVDDNGELVNQLTEGFAQQL